MSRQIILGGPGVYWGDEKTKINDMTLEIYASIDDLVPAYGEFYAYNKSILFNILTSDTYHCLRLGTAGDIVEGVSSGFTFNAGRVVDANITSEASGTGGKLRIVCSGVHSLTTGMLVCLANMNNAAHNKPTFVTIDGTNPTTEFLCDDITYVAGAGTSAGVVSEPASLLAGSGGDYAASFTIDGTAALSNKLWKFELNVDLSTLDNIVSERLSTSSLASLTSAGHITLTTGQRVWISGKNATDTSDFTIKNLNLSIHKLSA